MIKKWVFPQFARKFGKTAFHCSHLLSILYNFGGKMNIFRNFENIFFFGRWFSKIFEKQMTCPLVCLLCSVCSLRLVYLHRSVIWARKIKCFKSTMARFLTLLALTPPSAAGARPAALSFLIYFFFERK